MRKLTHIVPVLLVALMVIPTSNLYVDMKDQNGIGTITNTIGSNDETGTTNNTPSVTNDKLGTLPVSIGFTSNGTMSDKCMGSVGDYVPKVPDNDLLNATNVTNAELLSPINLNRGWYTLDHVGVKDTAFSGERHIVTRDGGMQWFGYDANPNNDMVLREFEGASKVFNVKQTPVRADWHTINGSGIVFGASLTGDYEKSLDLSSSLGTKFSGFCFVSTLSAMEVREYTNVSLENFKNGSAEYKVLYTEPKTCNSQSITVDIKDKKVKIEIGLRVCTELELKLYGDMAGAMVDYASHGCPSLSSVFMFNFSCNGVNFFEGGETK